MTTVPGASGSRLDPEPMPRRDFLGLASMWATAAAALFAVVGMLRLPKTAVLASPSRRFRVALPASLAEGEAFVPPGRSVALYRDAAGIYAISTVCTHLGCIVRPTAAGFECPCHGSRFAADGAVVKGPAPTALAWKKVVLSGDTCIVDEDSNVPAGTKVNA
ncbi:MAG TPA: Rieske 2Fe-2S domain-containing protein [Vicinamibacterales bacterium]|nr:Rieske 2Fe-2S domain-containing protein [Vicinamibacterales bacterium]